MDTTSFNRDKIRAGVDRARSHINQSEGTIRLIFSPTEITKSNFDAACTAYSQIGQYDFDTVVVVESSPGKADKKLVMPSFKSIETRLGEVPVNDRLRNDFADEEDDFFINDSAFHDNVGLYSQLMMLQCCLDDFSVSHIQVTDESSFIVKELAYTLEEVMAPKNALLVFCCDLEEAPKSEINRVTDILHSNGQTESALMNYLNGDDSSVNGVGTFVAGLLIAKKWGLELSFSSGYRENDLADRKIKAGYAAMQYQPIFG